MIQRAEIHATDHHLLKEANGLDREGVRAQELCEGRGGRPGLPVPFNPYGFSRRKATLSLNLCTETLKNNWLVPLCLSSLDHSLLKTVGLH